MSNIICFRAYFCNDFNVIHPVVFPWDLLIIKLNTWQQQTKFLRLYSGILYGRRRVWYFNVYMIWDEIFLETLLVKENVALQLIIFFLTFLCLWMLLACVDGFILFINYFLTFFLFGLQLSIFLFIFFHILSSLILLFILTILSRYFLADFLFSVAIM